MRLAPLGRDERGVSAIEFALILPILVLFSAGTIEVSRMVLLTQKLQSAAFTLADLTARIDSVKATDASRTSSLQKVFLAIDQVVKPFDFAAAGASIVTSVKSDVADNTPTVGWQCNGASGISARSAIGISGHTATLPAGFDIRKGETIVAAEVFFDFQPLFGIELLPAQVIHRVAYFKPRLGDLGSMTCP